MRAGDLLSINNREFILIAKFAKEEMPIKWPDGYSGSMWWVYHTDDHMLTSAYIGKLPGNNGPSERTGFEGRFSNKILSWCQSRRIWY